MASPSLHLHQPQLLATSSPPHRPDADSASNCIARMA